MPGQSEIDCPECGEIHRSKTAMKKHYDSNHKKEEIRPLEVCKWWRQGRCTIKHCKYAHVGEQNKSSPHIMKEKNIRVPACSNGPSCEWLERGCCSYFHPRVGVQRPWTRKESKNRRRQDTRSQNDTRFHQDTGSSQEIRFLDTRPRHDKEKPEPEGTKSLERILQQYQTYK